MNRHCRGETSSLLRLAFVIEMMLGVDNDCFPLSSKLSAGMPEDVAVVIVVFLTKLSFFYSILCQYFLGVYAKMTS